VAWIAERDRIQVLDELTGAGVPVAPVNDATGVLDDEQLLARGDLVQVVHEDLGAMTMLASPAWIDGWRSVPAASGFGVGRHNDEVYGELLGLDADELTRLREAGVV